MTSTSLLSRRHVLAAAGATMAASMVRSAQASSLYYCLKADAGAVGDGSTDDTQKFDQWLVHGFTTGQPLAAEAGHYKITSQQLINLNNYPGMPSGGLTIIGAGKGRTLFDLTSITAGVPFPAISLTSTTQANVYLSIKECTFVANTAGPTLQIGSENFSDSFDSGTLDISVQNENKASTACALELNFITDFEMRILAQLVGAGDAVRMRQVAFSTMKIGGGASTIGVHITSGYNFGNVFNSLDLENCGVCVQCDSASSGHNVFNGGQLNYNSYALNFTAGSPSIWNEPNYAPNPGAKSPVQNKTGLTINM